jgi:hypothetical protein
LDLTTVIDFEEDYDGTESLSEIKEGNFDDEEDIEDEDEDEDKNEDDIGYQGDEHRCSVRDLERRTEVLSLSVHGCDNASTPVDA